MLQIQTFRYVLLAGLLAGLAGCGSYPLAPGSAPQTGAQSPVTLNLKQQSGSIVIRFGDKFQTQATTGDVQYISVTISGSGLNYPLSQNLNWPLSKEAVFDGLSSGTYTVRVDALDKYYAVIGTISQANVAVQNGQSTPVSLHLSLSGGKPTQGGISLGITIDDGTPSSSPSATPSPAATPSPVVTPPPAPISPPTPAPSAPPAASAGLTDDFEHGFSNWVTAWTKSSYTSDTSAASNWQDTTFASNGGSHGACPGGSDGNVTQTGTYAMTLANSVDLSSNAHSVLRFDLDRFTAQYYFQACKFQVDASADGGNTWAQVYDQTTSQTDWKRLEVDLSSYKSHTVKVRFRFVYDYYLGTSKMSAPCIDNVYLGSN